MLIHIEPFSCFTEALIILGNCSSTTYDNVKNEITTPGFYTWPYLYGTNKACQWNVHEIDGNRIKLVFENFELEAKNCKHDYLNIFDGSASNAKQIGGRLCGAKKPKSIVSSGNKLHLQWRSDDSHVFRGFRVHCITIGEYF